MEKRKLLTIITEAAIERILIEDVERLGAHGYTLMEAQGKGGRGIRSSDWEQSRNIQVEIICDGTVADVIVQHLFKTYYEHYAMVVYTSDVEVIRPHKF